MSLSFNEALYQWMSIYAPTIGKGRGAKQLPYEVLNNGSINCPEGFALNYAGSDHPAYKRGFNRFPACVKIDTCGNFFNARGGAFLTSTTGFPKHITSDSDTFKFIVSSVDCNMDYFISCFNLAKNWIIENQDITVEFKMEIGKILNNKYFPILIKMSNSNIDKMTEKWFVIQVFDMITVVEDPFFKDILNDACEVYFHNRNSENKWEYGHQRKSMQKKENTKFDVKKSSKYFPIIDVLDEIRRNSADGIIKLQNDLQIKRFISECKSYAAKLYKNTPAMKMFTNYGLFDTDPKKWIDFISSTEFQNEAAEDPKGSKLSFALSREARTAVTREKNIKEGKKTFEDLGLYYSYDENTLRANNLNNIWVLQHIDLDYHDPENPNKKKLIDPLFIELRNPGDFKISDYETDLKYFYCNLIGMNVSNLINTRIRKYKTYFESQDFVLEDARNFNPGGDVRDLLGKNK